jgi:hypothetical protein
MYSCGSFEWGPRKALVPATPVDKKPKTEKIVRKDQSINELEQRLEHLTSIVEELAPPSPPNETPASLGYDKNIKLTLRQPWWRRVIGLKDSTFNFAEPVNHDCADLLSNISKIPNPIPDRVIIQELLSYLRANANPSYRNFDLKQDHAHKLALKWLKDPERKTQEVNSFNFMATINKHASARDDELLYARKQEINSKWTWNWPWANWRVFSE